MQPRTSPPSIWAELPAAAALLPRRRGCDAFAVRCLGVCILTFGLARLLLVHASVLLARTVRCGTVRSLYIAGASGLAAGRRTGAVDRRGGGGGAVERWFAGVLLWGWDGRV